MTIISAEDVLSRLHEITDPCSAATRVPLSIIEMGMVEKVEIAAGAVVVALRMTSPLCHALPYFQMEIERVLASNYLGQTPAGSLDRSAALDQYHQWKLIDFAIADLKTEMTGSTFIVTYTITLNGTAAGQPLPSPQHMMTVWHQHKSGWMIIAHSVSM